MTPGKEETQTVDRERASSLVPLASLVVTFVAIAVATLLPQTREMRLWGINHLAFYPTPVRIGALALMGLAFVPPVARGLHAALVRLPDLVSRDNRRSLVVITILSVASVLAFYHLRSATNLLGDGQLLVRSFEAAYQGSRTVVMRSVTAILTTENIAPGMTLLYYWTVKAVVAGFNRSVADAIVILPCLLGVAYVFFVLLIVREAPISKTLKAWLLVLGLFTSSIQLFFGYVENYSAILLFLAMYVASGFLVLHRRVGLWLPAVMFAVSVYTHIQSLIMLPSLIFLVVWRISGRRVRGAIRFVVPMIAALTVLGALAGRAVEIPGNFYLPWTENDESYGVVSPGHLLDMLNEVLMLFPIVLFALAVWWAGRSARKGTAGKDTVKWFKQPSEWRFVSLVLVACFTYMTFFKPEIGMARDWDLFTMATVGVVPLLLLILNRYFVHTRPSTAALVSAPALVMSIVLTASWVGVNASADRTTERYESILAYDLTHVGYAYENLATFYKSSGQLPKAITAMEKGARISGNPRVYARLAELYEQNGDIQGGITLLLDKVEKHPDHSKVRQKLMDLLEKTGQWDELTVVARGGLERHPDEAIYYYALGEAMLKTGKIDQGLEVFRACLSLDVPEGARNLILRRFREHNRTP